MAPAEARLCICGPSEKATRDATNQIQAHTRDTEFWFNFFWNAGGEDYRGMSFPQPLLARMATCSCCTRYSAVSP
jgi:hypothetical protein